MGKARGRKGGNKFASSFVYNPLTLRELGREGDHEVANLCISMLECPAVRIYSDCAYVARTTVCDIKKLILRRHGFALRREDIELYLIRPDAKTVPKEYLEGTVYEVPKHVLQGFDGGDPWRVCLNVRDVTFGGPTLLESGVRGKNSYGGFASEQGSDIPTVNILYSLASAVTGPTCSILDSEPWQVDPFQELGLRYNPDSPRQRAILHQSMASSQPSLAQRYARGAGAKALLNIAGSSLGTV